jgi:hypothetical protein
MVKKFIVYLGIIFLLAGCSYSVYSNAYPYLKTILIHPFPNKTVEYALADDLLNSLNSKFQQDARLRPVSLSPDCQLEGSILDFQEKVFSYDENNSVEEYQVQILFSITLTDLVKNQVIYENKSLLITERYAAREGVTTTRFKSKQEAEQEIFQRLFDEILKHSLESW